MTRWTYWLPVLLLAVASCQRTTTENPPEAFLGPKRGQVFTWNMERLDECRMIGAGPDADGVYWVIYEFTAPPEAFPDPLHEGQYLKKVYNQQLLYVDGSRIMLKKRSESATILDTARDEWTAPAPLVFGCTKEAVSKGMCPDPHTKTARFSITNRTRRVLFGKQREVLTATGVVHTEELGDISASRVFVSGLGIFEHSLPEDLRIGQITEEALAELEDYLATLFEAYRKKRENGERTVP